MEHWDLGSKKLSKFENARVEKQIIKFFGSCIICGLRIGPFFTFIHTNARNAWGLLLLFLFLSFFFFGGLATPLKAAAQRVKVMQPLLAWQVALFFFPLQEEDPTPLNSISEKLKPCA